MRHRFDFASQRLIWTWLLAFSTASIAFLAMNVRAVGEEPVRDKDEIVILAFGDSLTAGYEIPPDTSFPAQLQAALRQKGYKVRVLNSGVSGNTAAEGLARLDWSLDEPVDGAIVEFGANDALRGIDPKNTEQALGEILKALKDRHIELLLSGMEAPRNWGPDYDDAFRAMYPRLASAYGALFYPFSQRRRDGPPLEPCRRAASNPRGCCADRPQLSAGGREAHCPHPPETGNEP